MICYSAVFGRNCFISQRFSSLWPLFAWSNTTSFLVVICIYLFAMWSTTWSPLFISVRSTMQTISVQNCFFRQKENQQEAALARLEFSHADGDQGIFKPNQSLHHSERYLDNLSDFRTPIKYLGFCSGYNRLIFNKKASRHRDKQKDV